MPPKCFRAGILATCLLFSFSAHAAKLPTHETVKVADGIYAFISAESPNALVSGNCVAIIGDDGLVVVDSGNFPSETRKIIAEIRQLSPLPVRYLVHTHWHRDHIDGDNEFRAAFPNVVMVSTPYARKMIQERAIKNLNDEITQGPAIAAHFRKEAQDGKDSSGAAVNAEEKIYLNGFADSIEAAVAEFKQVTLLLPDETFDRDLDIFLGKREVQLKFLGRANTAGDAVIYVPDSKVVIAGDLLGYPTPFVFDSYLSEWIEVLAKLKAIGATTIIPGHGPIEHDTAYIDLVTRLLQSITAQVRQTVEQNLSLDETRKKVNVADIEREFTAGKPSRTRNFDNYCLPAAIERAYKEAHGLLNDEN